MSDLSKVAVANKPNNARYYGRGQSRMPLLNDTKGIIERFKDRHGDRYDYSLVEYKGSDCYVDIICKVHGVFSQRADQHAKGNNCPKCSKRHKPTNTEFIDQCKNKHGDKFKYKKTMYKNTRTCITVTCNSHGDFLVKPQAHLDSKHGGCPDCNPNKKLNLEEFIHKSRLVHGDYYDYSKVKFINVRGKVVIKCPVHGEFTKIVDHHLHGSGCQICGKEAGRQKMSMGLSEFIRLSNIQHDNKYDYSQVDYKNGYSKVKIICPNHGEFWQRPHGHLQARGCKECGEESKFNFKRKAYISLCDKSNNGYSNLYLIKCENDTEVFYKVGITIKTIKERFKGSVMPYRFQEILFITEKAGFIWDLECQLHRLLKPYTYRPKINFGGISECFSDIPNDLYKLIESFKASSQMQLIA